MADLKLGAFGLPLVPNGEPSPQLQVVATDLIGQQAFWFPAEAGLQEALVATSAIPGVFPWRTHRTPTGALTLVDGAVVENQPLTRLMEQGCGRIYACAVGAGPPVAPNNLIDNIMRSTNVSIHQCSKLEEALVRGKMGPNGVVIHIHPEGKTPLPDFNFTAELVNRAVDEACQLTLAWLATNPTT